MEPDSLALRELSAKLGEEPDVYKILVYNQLTADEVARCSIPVEKLIFWDITASLPGNTVVDAPHVTIFWYGPHVSEERGSVIRLKSVKLDSKFTQSIRSLVVSKVGGEVSEKEGGVEFRNFTMKVTYGELAALAKSLEKLGNMALELSLEFGRVTKEEKQKSTFPKTKILGERALE